MKKTGFIAIIGRPNVGKSSLLNQMVGEKVAIVSSKPQTTRNRVTGILTKGDNQFVFVDTPGMMKPRNKLGSYMIRSIKNAVSNVDAVIFVADCNVKPGTVDIQIAEKISKEKIPAVLVLNKIDKAGMTRVAEAITEYSPLCEFDSVIPVSALKNDGVDIVLSEIEKYLYESDWFFPDDISTDQPERQIASEVIREKILRTMNDEIPHGTAVVIDEFKEESKLISIRATIYCEKEGHKRILIGKGGASLKKIGTYAREDLEEIFGIKVFLDLWVKVKENWRESDYNVKGFGYKEDN